MIESVNLKLLEANELLFGQRGNDLYLGIIDYLLSRSNLDCIFVAEYHSNYEKLELIAISKEKDTPIVKDLLKHDLLEHGAYCIFSNDQDKDLSHLFKSEHHHFESYFIVQLMGHNPLPNGIIAGFSQTKFNYTQDFKDLLSLFSKRVATELDHEKRYRKAIAERSNIQRVFHEHNLISSADLKGNITYVNDTFCEVNGYTKSELLGQNHRMIKSNEHSKEFYEDLWSTITNGQTWNGIIKNKTKGGDDYWVNATIYPIVNDKREITHYMSARTNITKEKELQNTAIVLKEKAEKITQSKSMFLANMSHEIRTPMNGIQGSLSLLLDSELNAEQKEMALMSYHSAQSLNVIVNDILDISKLESGKVKLEKICIDYKVIIDDVIQIFKSQARDKKINLIKNFPQKYPGQLLGDPTRLRQILTNLVSNALKFTKEGQVDIKVGFIKKDQEHYNIITTVNDTGIGMTANQLKHLFDAFQQADQTTTRLYGATGLGTCICKSLVELQGGEIQVSSELNRGTTFSYTIPAKVTKEKYLKADTKDKPERDYQKTVLLAEDNLINLKIAKRTLEKLGLKVIVANNGKEAIEMAKNDDHDLILMDIQMPIMNGLDATQHLIEAGHNKPITAMTSNVMEEDLKKYDEIGMSGCIPKPFKVQDIVKVLDSLISPENYSN